jgi:hypothetical protein
MRLKGLRREALDEFSAATLERFVTSEQLDAALIEHMASGRRRRRLRRNERTDVELLTKEPEWATETPDGFTYDASDAVAATDTRA